MIIILIHEKVYYSLTFAIGNNGDENRCEVILQDDESYSKARKAGIMIKRFTMSFQRRLESSYHVSSSHKSSMQT